MPEKLFEKRMDFVAEQLAKCETDIARLTEAQTCTDGMIRNLVDGSLSLTHHLEETDARLNERLDRWAQAEDRTDGKLDALIDVMDKWIRRKGGRRPDPITTPLSSRAQRGISPRAYNFQLSIQRQ